MNKIEIKALDDNTALIRGYAVVYGEQDLEGDTFTPDTDLAWDYVPAKALLWDHGLDDDVKTQPLGTVTGSGVDEVGRWIEAQVERSRSYGRAVLRLIEQGRLGLSTGSVTHLVAKSDGQIKRWPVVEVSLTPTPAEPRTLGVSLKALLDEAEAEAPEAAAEAAEDAAPAAVAEAAAEPEPIADAVATEAAAAETPAAVTTDEDAAPDGAESDTMSEEMKTLVDALAAKFDTMQAAIEKLVTEPPVKSGLTLPAEPKKAEEAPFKSLGEFLHAVSRANNESDGRLRPLMSPDPVDENGYDVARALGPAAVSSLYAAKSLKAPSGMGETPASAGGFLVSTDRAAGILSRVYGTGQLLQRIDMAPISAGANGMTFYAEDETSRAAGYRRGGIQAYWQSEAAQLSSSAPKFREMELRLKKVTGLVYATDELLADASALEAWVMNNLPDELRFKVEDSIVNGTGAGMPLGLLNCGALVSVAKEAGQSADTIVFENIVNMYSRMWAPGLSRAVWLISQDCWPQLYTMALSVGTGGSAAFLPPAGLAQAPYGTLLGRPVIPTEYNPKLGDLGDILFVDLGEYQGIEKGGIQSASSIHVRFIYGENTFRFVYRIDGQPKWNAALTQKNASASTVSPYVALAERA